MRRLGLRSQPCQVPEGRRRAPFARSCLKWPSEPGKPGELDVGQHFLPCAACESSAGRLGLRLAGTGGQDVGHRNHPEQDQQGQHHVRPWADRSQVEFTHRYARRFKPHRRQQRPDLSRADVPTCLIRAAEHGPRKHYGSWPAGVVPAAQPEP